MKRLFLIITFISGMMMTTMAQDVKVKTGFDQTLKAYFDLKNALAADNASLAETKANSLLLALKTFPVKNLTAAQQAEWKKQTIEIQRYTAPIVAEKDLKLQRKSFENVAAFMIRLVKGLQLNSAELYVQYCPMVKRSWLNEVQEIQNPFYGSKMYDCGEVTDTLAKK